MCLDKGQAQSFESIKTKTSLDKGQNSRTLAVSFLFVGQSLTSQFFLPFLLLQKLFSRNDSVWQMACPWQLYSTNPVLYYSDT